MDMNMECLDFVRIRRGRLDFDDSRSSTGDGVWLNHFVICPLLVSLGTAYYDFAGSSVTDSHSSFRHASCWCRERIRDK